MSERILTALQVAELFQIDRETIYKMAQQGHLPAFKIGYQWRFSESALREWYTSQTTIPSCAMSLEDKL